jgi:glyoxylase-like metal-dependent hydrolase (beta-lactamase superfamily II)
MSITDNNIIRPRIQRFAAGQARVTTILDGAHVRPELRPPFAMDKSDAELEAVGRANRLPWGRFENTYTPTLIETGDDIVLIDVGFGAAGRADGAGRLRQALSEIGRAPEDITIVAFTHVHPDHILGVMEDGELAFPKARHMIGRHEFDAWFSGDKIPPQREKNRQMFMNLIAPLKDQLTFLDDGDAVAKDLAAEAAFGHSAGHLMFRLNADEQPVLIWGDVCTHYVFSMQSPDSPVAFDDDKERAIATRKRVLEMAATDDLLVVGHHMPFPSVGYVERDGKAYRWVPAAYQLWI